MSREGITKVRQYFRQGYQHELPPGISGMWKDQVPAVMYERTVGDEINIDGARSAGCMIPGAAQDRFNLLAQRQQLTR